MGFFSWIIVGAIAGYLADMLMGSSKGVLGTVVLGIVGGLLGGFVAASVLHKGNVDGINVESIVIATIGAIAIILIARVASGERGLRRSS
jgi:uncharacterized membrane protein YeaQ/YmgE (transglycosylase-associated protein family)